ncbi:hypothetical protein [Hydrogenophaga sp.]|uniref:hypothetical protein n=1 Tax=Hydrogenophaga sp. TaxID=1904254 RepID=UPI002FC5E4B1
MSNRIIFTRPDGGVSIIIPAPEISIARALQDVPADASNVEVVEADAVPADRTFREAWKQEGKALAVDVPKAKDIAHVIRRAKRAEEFAPHDQVISLRLPGEEAAEAERVAIRAKYALVQDDIDAAESPDELKLILTAV